MRVLLCHNYYQQPGGEDECFHDESRLLESNGHEVVRFTLHNDAITRMKPWTTAFRTIWSRQTYADLREIIRQERPNVMHCTNTFPLISPAAYYAARSEGIPVVQSLHNYRLFCCNVLLLRDGHVCEDCMGKWISWPGVLHACYRQSRAASAVVVALESIHRLARTWTRAVDVYVALSEFSRRKFVAGGLPEKKIIVKPNFVHPDPGPGNGSGGYAVFVGRLSPEKGIDTLIEAWDRLKDPVPLRIVGAGPLDGRVKAAARRNPNIRWLGRRPIDEVLSIVGDAACLLMPSICYEHFPRTIVEAFAKGTPAIASRMGAMAELLKDGHTGLLFAPADCGDLASKVRRLFANPPALATMRANARREYERKYTAEINHRVLTAIYARALEFQAKGVERASLRGFAGERSRLPAAVAGGSHVFQRPSAMTAISKETQG